MEATRVSLSACNYASRVGGERRDITYLLGGSELYRHGVGCV